MSKQNRSEIYIPQGDFTGAPDYKPIENPWCDSVVVILTIHTAATGAQTVVLNIEGFDPASGTWYLILASAAKTAAGQTVLRVGPKFTAATNTVAQDNLPLKWRIRPVHANNTDTISYSVGYNECLG